MTDLEQRLQRLEACDAISKLKAAYCEACDDDHNGAGVAALFIEDGHWEYSGRPPVIGRDAIADHMFFIRASKAIRCSAHLLHNPVVDVDGNQAMGRWRFVMLYTASDGESIHRIIGRYDDRFVLHRGEWRFVSLVAHVEQRGSCEARHVD